MKKDVNDLKKLVHEIMSGSIGISNVPTVDYQPEQVPHEPSIQDVETVEVGHTMEDAEKDLICKTLEKNRGQKRKTAIELNISERTLYRKIKEYGL